MTGEAAASGAIDLGGTKIEARLLDGELGALKVRRWPTPRAQFDSFIAALAGAIGWLRDEAGDPALPVGICLPGIVDPATGLATAANIPVTGQDIGAALARALPGAPPAPIFHDGMAFAASEAAGGAGDGARVVAGLVLGTGVGAGLVIDGALPPRRAGLGVEVGHLGVPARTLAAHGLPLLPCGCGKAGCFDVYASGTGLTRIAEALTGAPLGPEDIPAHPEGARILAAWAEICAEALLALQFTLDPEVIVLGGGVSRMEGVLERLTQALAACQIAPGPGPRLALAAHGDASGARGAALLARQMARQENGG